MISNLSSTNNYNQLNNLNSIEKDFSQNEIRQKKRTGEIECETCENRKYVDGSDDSGVSFKTPTNISANESASKVMSHEREHYSREASSAERENAQVLSNTITTSKAVCPECGKSYTSGGQTRTVKRIDTNKEEDKAHFNEQFYQNTIAKHFGKNLDIKF